MQNFTALGRLTKDPELISFPSKKGDTEVEVAKFVLACDDGFGDYKKTTFLNCSVIGKRASTIEKYLKKGSQLLISQSVIEINRVTDKEGDIKLFTNIIVKDFHFVGGVDKSVKKEKVENQREEIPKGKTDLNIDIDDEDLPF